MTLSIIAAIGRNNELGKDNQLIWHLPGDLRFFKETTMGKTIVMGHNTFLSLPRKLVNRHYIVLTSKNIDLGEDIQVYHNMDDMLDGIQSNDEEVFVIGGASVYRQSIDKCDKLYLTEIDAEAEADVYFPTFNHDDYTGEVIDQQEENGIKYKHMVYRRKK